MNEFQIAIMVGAVATAFIARKLPHAWLWISLGAINAIVCNFFYYYNLPYPAAFTLACDALMCLAIQLVARERWEISIFILYQFSVLVSVARLATVVGIWSVIDSEGTYRLTLELTNWAILFMIFSTAILGGARGYALRSAWVRYVSWAYHYMRGPPKAHYWRTDRR